MNLSRVSILIPVFNEARTLRELLAQVDAAPVAGLQKELIIVDDGSTDGTREILERLEGLQTPFRVVFHGQNMGKGAAIRTALTYATGDLILVQDADLEYDPRDYEDLVAPILRGRADVVYGSRLRGGKPVRDFSLLYLWGNKFVTLVTNVLYGAALTDMETGYKLFRADVIKNLQHPRQPVRLRARGYGQDPEAGLQAGGAAHLLLRAAARRGEEAHVAGWLRRPVDPRQVSGHGLRAQTSGGVGVRAPSGRAAPVQAEWLPVPGESPWREGAVHGCGSEARFAGDPGRPGVQRGGEPCGRCMRA